MVSLLVVFDVVAVDVAAGLPPMMAVDLTRWRGVGTGWAFTYFFVNFITFWFLMAVCFVPFIKIGFTPGECQCVFQCVCVCVSWSSCQDCYSRTQSINIHTHKLHD